MAPLQMPEDIRTQFDAVTRLTDDGLCLCEMVVGPGGTPEDYRFLEVNSRFEEYTGLKDAKGRTALELVPDLERHWIETYARVGLGGESLRFENGSVSMRRWFEVYATPADVPGQLWILFRDVSARKSAEIDREEALDQAHRLFEELSHRVKNSLAIVRAILSQEARISPGEVKEVLDRVGSRIAAIENLYDEMSRARAIDEVDARQYLSSIVEYLDGSAVADTGHRITAAFAELALSGRQAVSVALILNELVTNSIKHAFKDRPAGTVAVALEALPGALRLSVSDNGSGAVGDANAQKGLGEKLIEAFVTDLEGELAVERAATGTRTIVTFPRHPGRELGGGRPDR